MNPEKTFTVKSSISGKNYSFTIISLDKAQNLIQSHEGIHSTELSKFIRKDKKVFILNDNRVIQFSDTDAYLFESEEIFMLSLEEWLTEMRENRKKIEKKFPRTKELPLANFQKLRYKELISNNPQGMIAKTAVNDWNGSLLQPILDAGGELIPKKDMRFQQAYRTTEGKVVVFYLSGWCLEFENEADYNALANYWIPWQGKPEKYYFLQGRNPYGPDFLDKIPELTKELTELTKTSISDLNFSLDSLKLLWKALKEETFTEELVNKIYLPLLAYIGEVQIKTHGGKWDLTYDDHYHIWIPEVLSPTGRKTELYLNLFENLDPEKEKFAPFDSLLRRV